MSASSLAALVVAVRLLDADLYRKVEVADALDTSTSTLRRLGLSDWQTLGPSRVELLLGVQVWLYDMGRIEVLAAHLGSHRVQRGRPRLWDDEQRRIRRAQHCAASYSRRRARELSARRDSVGAMVAEHRAELLTAELSAMSPLSGTGPR